MKFSLHTLMAFGLITSCSYAEFKGSAPISSASYSGKSKPIDPATATADPVATDPAAVPAEPAIVPPDTTVVPPDSADAEPATTPTTPPIFTGCVAGDSTLPIVADVYQLPEGSSKLPDFKTIGTKSDTVCLSQYNIENQAWDIGFPGANQLVEWFALNTRAKLIVPADGSYEFRMSSDDGSILYIDAATIIDNDGNHTFQSKEGTVQLTAGNHTLGIDWYQGPRFNLGLQLFWKVPGTTEFVIVPSAAFAPE